MPIAASLTFDPAQDSADNRGWLITWYDTANINVSTKEWYWRLRNAGTLRSTVTTKALTTNVVTITTAVAHGYAVGQWVQVLLGDASFDGTFVIASVTATTFTYANTAANVVSVASGGYTEVSKLAVHAATIVTKALTTNVATLTFSGPHAFIVGEWVTVAMTLADLSFDGTYQVVSVTSTTLTYAKVLANVASVGASGTANTAKSADGRMRELFATDTNGVIAALNAKAQAALIVVNAATIAANVLALIAAEGLDTP